MSSEKKTEGQKKYSKRWFFYSRPFLIMAKKSHRPMTADTAMPENPNKDIPKINGGVLAMITRAEPIIKAAMIMEKAIRLPVLLFAD